MPLRKTKYAQAINDEILEKLSLENRYTFLNENFRPILSDSQLNFLESVQEFCLNFEKENDITHSPEEDLYDWIPAFGKQGLITRMHDVSCIDLDYEPHGLVADFMRILGTDQFDPQFTMITGATVICINPIYWHHNNIPVYLRYILDIL